MDINQKWLLHCHADVACGQDTKFQTVPTYSLGDISEYVTQYWYLPLLLHTPVQVVGIYDLMKR